MKLKIHDITESAPPCPASTLSAPQSQVVREGMGSEHTSISRRTSRPLIASTFFATEYRKT